MNIITKVNMEQFVVSGEFDIKASFSADEEAKASGESKSVVLRFVMDKTPLSSIIASSLKDKRINKQTTLRQHPERYTDGQVIRFNYVGETYVDPEQAFMAKFDAGSRDEKLAMIEELRARVKAQKGQE